MGTSSRTSVPLILADELDADWKRVKIEQAIGDPRYGDQDTDGSHSVRDGFVTMREAGATARLMLTQAAAQKWGVPVSECESDLHVIVHRPSKRKAGYGELASAAAKLPVPKKEDLQFKPKSAWRYIGKGATSYDLANLCTGKAGYRHGRPSRWHGLRLDRASAGARRQGQVLRRESSAAGEGRQADDSDQALHPAASFSAAGRSGGHRRQHLGRISGTQEAECLVGQRGECRLQLGSIQERAAGNGAQAGQGGAQYRRRGCGVCQGRKDRGGGVLRASSGACADGTAGRTGRLSRRQGDGVDLHAESAGRAGDCRRRAGHPQGKRDLPRDPAGWRVRAEVEAGLRGRGSGSVESHGQAGQGGVEPGRRHQVRLLSRRGGHVHEGRARRKGQCPLPGCSARYFRPSVPPSP